MTDNVTPYTAEALLLAVKEYDAQGFDPRYSDGLGWIKERAAELTRVMPATIPNAAYDKEYNRYYLPLPGGWEVQTKGHGSSFRITGPGNFRLLIEDRPYLHDTLTRMALGVRAALNLPEPSHEP